VKVSNPYERIPVGRVFRRACRPSWRYVRPIKVKLRRGRAS
jgi:hypothetical protein